MPNNQEIMETPKGLGEVLKEIRLRKGVSLRELSENIGISHAYVNKLEKGINPLTGKKVTPTMDTIVKIANGLCIPVKDLLAQCGYFDADEATDIDEYINRMISDLHIGEYTHNGETVSKQQLESLANSIKLAAGSTFDK